MSEQPSNKKFLTGTLIVLVSSGLLAWSLVSLFQTSELDIEDEPYAEEEYETPEPEIEEEELEEPEGKKPVEQPKQDKKVQTKASAPETENVPE